MSARSKFANTPKHELRSMSKTSLAHIDPMDLTSDQLKDLIAYHTGTVPVSEAKRALVAEFRSIFQNPEAVYPPVAGRRLASAYEESAQHNRDSKTPQTALTSLSPLPQSRIKTTPKKEPITPAKPMREFLPVIEEYGQRTASSHGQGASAVARVYDEPIHYEVQTVQDTSLQYSGDTQQRQHAVFTSSLPRFIDPTETRLVPSPRRSSASRSAPGARDTTPRRSVSPVRPSPSRSNSAARPHMLQTPSELFFDAELTQETVTERRLSRSRSISRSVNSPAPVTAPQTQVSHRRSAKQIIFDALSIFQDTWLVIRTTIQELSCFHPSAILPIGVWAILLSMWLHSVPANDVEFESLFWKVASFSIIFNGFFYDGVLHMVSRLEDGEDHTLYSVLFGVSHAPASFLYNFGNNLPLFVLKYFGEVTTRFSFASYCTPGPLRRLLRTGYGLVLILAIFLLAARFCIIVGRAHINWITQENGLAKTFSVVWVRLFDKTNPTVVRFV
eukprot:TRINITY_DN5261_c0_g1_i4.p1 TRINITY_DN5261_c0_g1~~TRINITY_DN5261_c0_g1_i4.p1  ORF type:complete len:502 (-),score=79.57 TRINITY_DN5261_c0_g1_i4:395-1900(-)